MFIDTVKNDCAKRWYVVVIAVGKMENCYSEGRRFQRVSGTFTFVDI